MTSSKKLMKVYKAGRLNKEFLKEIKEADNDEAPDNSRNTLDKVFFALTFYGWLVGKYGPKEWNNHI
jgi:hypothetical protein